MMIPGSECRAASPTMCLYTIYSLVLCVSFIYPISAVDDVSVLLISFDGFRYDFIHRSLTPNLLKVKERGATPEYMRNVFPTKTYPNHHSIATGLFPAVHGVLANSVFKQDFRSEFTYDDEQLWHYNKEIEPIWITNEWSAGAGEGQGQTTRRSGVMMWPGAQHKYQNRTVTFSVPIDRSMPWNERIDRLISWFTHPETPVNLGIGYFEEPDTQCHLYGPNSHQVNEQIKRVDDTVGHLIEQIDKHNLTEKLNVIIVSDHGSHESSFENLIDLGHFVDMSALTWAGTSPVLQIQPKKGQKEAVFKNLTEAAKCTGKFKVYRKEDIPDSWHYSKNNRLADLLVLAEVGYAFQGRIKHIDEDWKAKYYNITLKPGQVFGVHGYSNEELSMRPIFLAWGPKVKENYSADPFDNIDIHPLISYMLTLPPLPSRLQSNGSLANVAAILKTSPPLIQYFEK